MTQSITIVGIPKPFKGRFQQIQANAIRSWAHLPGEKSILLLAECSAQEIGDEIGAICCPEVPTDSRGTPLFGPAMELARRGTKGPICYINADIIVDPALTEAISQCVEDFGEFLAVGKRWNIDFNREITFTTNWFDDIRKDVLSRGTLFAPQAIDLFCFTESAYETIPPFSIGRSYWDNWMIYAARKRGIPVIDITDRVMLVHQNHDYTGYRNLAEIRTSFQGRRNFFLAGNTHTVIATIEDASHRIDPNGTVRPTDVTPVSVVVPFGGRLSELRALLNTLVHQTYPRSWIEIVVAVSGAHIDLGSLPTDFPHVTFARELKRSAATARNLGVAVSSGRIIALVDSDCTPTNTWIAEGVAALKAGGGKVFIGGQVEQVVRKGERRSIAGAIGAAIFLQQESYVRSHGTCATANMFVWRATFEEVGAFDETFTNAGGEDWDWSKRASAAGFSAVYARNAKVYHPTLNGRKELAQKFDRIIDGNCRLELARRNRLYNSSTFEHAVPGLAWLSKRSRGLFRDPRLSRRERVLGVLMLASLMPRLRRRWRSAGQKLAAQ